MTVVVVVVVAVVLVALFGFALAVRVVTQYEKGVLFRLGRVVGVKNPGLAVIIPVIDRLIKVSLRIITMPIQSRASSPATTSASTFPRSPISGSSTR